MTRTGCFRIAALLFGPLLLACGCGRSPSGSGASAPTSMFRHVAPHGGTIVELGDGDYHLELVRDAGAGTLSAYVFDDDLEDFVRSTAHSITILATANGGVRRLVLAAVANPATGETVGDTALFQGRADWLRTTASFDARLLSIPVRGSTFDDVVFPFPAGNDRD